MMGWLPNVLMFPGPSRISLLFSSQRPDNELDEDDDIIDEDNTHPCLGGDDQENDDEIPDLTKL